jgi:glycosyltransferase involved in cell wall biosynthesis
LLKKRVLIAHPILGASGGGNGVAAWAIEALRGEYDVTLATLRPVNLPAVNRTFGTSLRDGDFRLCVAPPGFQLLLKAWPTPGALLETCLTMRLAQQLDRQQHFDVLLGTQNEVDFGRRGIHYVHHPWVFLPRPEHEMRWFHYIPGMLNGYRLMCQFVARCDNSGLRRNLSLANSRFIAGRIRATHGVESTILYPPVAGGFPDVPWEERVRGFVAVGRVNGCKRWDMAVSIIDEVRRSGHDVTLTLIGNVDDREWLARLSALAAERPWFRILTDVSRQELASEVARHRYGIHTMEDEHFGMAPAEIQRAGCIVFVHNSGGPVEIVGADSRLLFDDVPDAARKISGVLSSPDEEASLRRHVAIQRENFSEERFCSSLREIVKSFAPV